jgi:putative endonuclease
MIFYVYILESETSGKWYYGFTENIVKRFIDHQNNRSKYTKFRGPWKLIFKREFLDKREALHFEKQLKKARNKDFIKEKFKDYFVSH